MKKEFNNQKRKYFEILAMTAIMAVMLCAPVYATAALDAKMNVIYDLVMSIVKGIGLVLIAFGLMDFGPGLSQHDSAQQLAGLKKMGGGAAMLLGPQIIQLLM